VWIDQSIGSGNLYGGIKLDPAGQFVYATGYGTGPTGGSAFVAQYLAAAPGPLNPPWVPVTFAPFGVRSAGRGIGVDGQGNVYVTGDLWNGGTSQAMVFKQNANGTPPLVYVQPNSAGPGIDSGTAIDVDPLGNCYVTGYLDESLGGPGTGPWDLWSAKFTPALVPVSPQFNLRWFSLSGVSFEGEGIRADANGAPYVSGFFGPNAAMMRLNNTFGAPTLVTTFPWPLNTGGPDVAWAIALNNVPTGAPQGVYLTGSFAYLAPNNGPNLFVAKLISTWP
jgi:hypothetical protein